MPSAFAQYKTSCFDTPASRETSEIVARPDFKSRMQIGLA